MLLAGSQRAHHASKQQSTIFSTILLNEIEVCIFFLVVVDDIQMYTELICKLKQDFFPLQNFEFQALFQNQGPIRVCVCDKRLYRPITQDYSCTKNLGPKLDLKGYIQARSQTRFLQKVDLLVFTPLIKPHFQPEALWQKVELLADVFLLLHPIQVHS